MDAIDAWVGMIVVAKTEFKRKKGAVRAVIRKWMEVEDGHLLVTFLDYRTMTILSIFGYS
jgi:hypothetical protein